ncbi:type II toxin-antitoxin system Phd/YefM family antitoxin [Frankia tisae]|uniref:type II toxin-antitoxin system Phd/YefM family antitoxin n=1 Tax=Frankia tisae TaxID=2950104 RepID=UPI0021BECA1D|nr:type II toxin-antitoxin system Phd/YefM family antitoxin [Frankia tisae]
MTRQVPVTQARGELSDLVSRVAFSGERISLTRHGKAVAALVSAEDLARLEALDAGEEREERPDDRIELGRPRIDPIQPVPAPARRFDIAAEHRQPPHPDRGGRP